MARSLGKTGLALKEDENKLAKGWPKNKVNQVGGSSPLLGGDLAPQNLIFRLSGDGGFLPLFHLLGGNKLALPGLSPSVIVSGGQVLLLQGRQLVKQRQVSRESGK